MSEHQTEALDAAMRRAGARLRRCAGRQQLRRGMVWVAGLALALGATRSLFAPLPDTAPLFAGAVLSLASIAAVALVGAALLVGWGRRHGPSALATARAIDDALDQREVVASGWAFLKHPGPGPSKHATAPFPAAAAEVKHDGPGPSKHAEAVAVRRACAAVDRLDVVRAFPLPSVRPRRRTIAGFLAGLVVAVALGAYDPTLVSALITPPTAEERAAAEALDSAAAELAANAEERERDGRDEERRTQRDGAPATSERLRSIADQARSAARAARRGDREGALSKLSQLGREGRERAARAESMRRTLRRLRETLGTRAAGSPSSGSPSSGSPNAGSRAGAERERPGRGEASDELRLLQRRAREEAAGEREMDAAERQRTLERLSRAAEELRRQSEAPGQDSESTERAARAAEALSRAAESLSRGASEEAAARLAEAAARAGELEESRRQAAAEAEAIARMLEASGALERALQMAMLGRAGQRSGAGEHGQVEAEGEGRDGQGKGEAGGAEALRRALAARLAAMAGDQPGGSPDVSRGGVHLPERGGEQREGMEVDGSLRARAHVREGQRAAAAVRGLGARGETTREYRDVFPAYDAMAEEAMQDESVPASRRGAVRRYFESIRPMAGQNIEQTSEEP